MTVAAIAAAVAMTLVAMLYEVDGRDACCACGPCAAEYVGSPASRSRQQAVYSSLAARELSAAASLRAAEICFGSNDNRNPATYNRNGISRNSALPITLAQSLEWRGARSKVE